MTEGEAVRACTRCGNCCKTFDLRLVPPPEVLEFLKAHYQREIDHIWITLNHKCAQLVEDGPGKYKCKIYKKRPWMCKTHECDWMKGSDIGRFIKVTIDDNNIT